MEQSPGSLLIADIPEQHFPGPFLPGGQRQQQQQQDERRRRISLSGCFLKITLPLSAGQGCSRLNNRSGPALPSPPLLQGAHWQPQPWMCRVDAAAQPLSQHLCPQGLNISKGTQFAASPTLLPLKNCCWCCWGCPELTLSLSPGLEHLQRDTICCFPQKAAGAGDALSSHSGLGELQEELQEHTGTEPSGVCQNG